ncbi:hypothetical protein [Williamsia soli]|nr:hypothetical protein [Williamsia soli]
MSRRCILIGWFLRQSCTVSCSARTASGSVADRDFVPEKDDVVVER